MSDASIYAYLSMEQAVADAGLAPEVYQNNPRVGLIAGSGGGSQFGSLAQTPCVVRVV